MASSAADAEADSIDVLADPEDATDASELSPLQYDVWSGVDRIESLCMSCGDNGITYIMLHKIPYFRELILASFSCNECGERNNEVTFGGEIQPQGCSFELLVREARDLDRQVIKSDSACVKLVELDFEIPPLTQKGEISTIEGFLRTAAKNLAAFQAERMEQQPEVAVKVAEVIVRLSRMANGDELPFTFIVQDIAGNSFVQNLSAPAADPYLKISHFRRSGEQDASLGLQPADAQYSAPAAGDSDLSGLMEGSFGALKPPAGGSAWMGTSVTETETGVSLGRSEVILIPSHCPNCGTEGDSKTAITDIPHFKEVIIMAFDCGFCGFRNNEVKGGGAVPSLGTEVQLRVDSPEDLKRDVLKSDTCTVTIPQLELEMQSGTLGGVYTTVEGLLKKIHANLLDANPFACGDSISKNHSERREMGDMKSNFVHFMDRLEGLSAGREFGYSLQLRDPMGNSFVSARLGSFLPPEADPQLEIADFERTFEEDEDIGLNDMNTRDFETGLEPRSADRPVLPDRLTHVQPKSADHPLPFAQGLADGTPGGYLADATAAAAAASPSVEVRVRREFDAHDASLRFEAYEEFSGRREGYVFRMGAQGLGYYQDARPAVVWDDDGDEAEAEER